MQRPAQTMHRGEDARANGLMRATAIGAKPSSPLEFAQLDRFRIGARGGGGIRVGDGVRLGARLEAVGAHTYLQQGKRIANYRPNHIHVSRMRL